MLAGMKRLALTLLVLLAAAPAWADDEVARIDAGAYSCASFQADTAAESNAGYAGAAQYTLVFLHVGVEAVGLPHRPVTPDREATILGALRDLCRAEIEADFRRVLARYLRSPAFRDWWSQQI